MGLDISAYSNVELKRDASDPNYDGYDDGLHRLYINTETQLRHDGMTDGWYSAEREFDFRAGSYSGYNEWRRELTRLVYRKEPKQIWENPHPGPFVELIDFSDCEGTIGPKTSAKLAKDFADWQDRAEGYAAKSNDGDWFIRCYNDWRKGFEMAAQNGFVSFH